MRRFNKDNWFIECIEEGYVISNFKKEVLTDEIFRTEIDAEAFLADFEAYYDDNSDFEYDCRKDNGEY